MQALTGLSGLSGIVFTDDPGQFSGLVLWLDGRESRKWRSYYAGQFIASGSDYLNVATNADLEMGDIDFWVAGWIFADSTSGTLRAIVGKWDLTTGSEVLEYSVHGKLDGTTLSVVFRVSSNGASNGTKSCTVTLPNVSTGEWHFFLGWYDATANTVNCVIDNGMVGTPGSLSGGAFVGTSDFRIGAHIGTGGVASEFWDGRIGPVAVGKTPVGGIAGVISDIQSRLYNSEDGLDYDALTSQEKTDWGLVAWWDLQEKGTARSDREGSNTLSDNNGVGVAVGKVQALAEDGNTVVKLDNIANSDDSAIQHVFASRPTFEAATASIVFDGSNDSLTLGDLTSLDFGTGDFSVFIVVDSTDVSSAIFVKDDWAASGNGIFIYNGGAYLYWNGASAPDFGANGVKALLGVVREGTGANETKLYYNGALATTTTDARDLSNGSTAKIADSADGGHPLSGKIHAIAAYNRALPDLERQALEAHFLSL